jgi:DNA polymerase-3 subunit alpha
MSDFIHLHTHSHYSLLDGLAKIDDLVSEAAKNKMSALALTDHGNMHGAIEFYKKAKAADIKPIIGIETYVAPRSRHQKETGIDAKPYHLVLLAKSEGGYKNLLKLASLANLEGFYYKPRVDKELLAQYSKDIIASTACLGGEIPRLLLSEKHEQAKQSLKEYQDIFGPDSFFLEIQHHPAVPNYETVNKQIIALAKETKTPLLATQDIHYLR